MASAISERQSSSPFGATFELKLKVKFAGYGRQPLFTESLILAQDERWRRA